MVPDLGTVLTSNLKVVNKTSALGPEDQEGRPNKLGSARRRREKEFQENNSIMLYLNFWANLSCACVCLIPANTPKTQRTELRGWTRLDTGECTQRTYLNNL